MNKVAVRLLIDTLRNKEFNFFGITKLKTSVSDLTNSYHVKTNNTKEL
jgi:hypothetical protein